MLLPTELTLADKLVRLRGAESQVDAAHRIGIAPSSLCCLEKGLRAGSTHRTLTLIADAYNVAVEYLTSNPKTYLRTWADREYTWAKDLGSPGRRLTRLIAELHVRYGVTHSQFAQALNLSENALQLYLEDRAAPRALFELVEDATGVSTDLLLFGSPLPPAVNAAFSPAIIAAIQRGVTPSELLQLIEKQR